MGTRRWTLSTFVGCCIWILHGVRAAAAVPVTTEEPFAVGTASPTAAETEWPHALVTGTAEMSTAAADAESIFEGSSVSPSFPPGAEPGALVTAASSYGTTIPTSTNVTKPLNASQNNERGLAAPAAATTAASISTQHPAVTPEAEHDVMGAVPEEPLGTTPLFADVKGDVLVDVDREGANLDPTVGDVIFPSASPLAVTRGAQPTAGSPMGASVTVLLSQGFNTATGAVEEGATLPVEIQSEASANSSSSGAGKLLMQDGAVSRAVDITPEPLGEITLAGKESPSASASGDAGDTVNGALSTAGASHLSPESVTLSETVGNPGESSLLPGQAVLSPAASLASSSSGKGQGGPGMSSDTPGSASFFSVSEGPAVIGDKITSLPAPRVPTDAQTDGNPPALATVLPRGDMESVDLAEPSLQPAPWQSSAGEEPPLLPAALPFPMDTSSSPGAAYSPPGTEASTLPAPDNGTEMPVSPELAAAPGAPLSPLVGVSQPWGMAAGAPQGAEGPSTGLNSVLNAPSAASFIPEGLAWPTNRIPAQETEDAGDMAQSGGPGDGSLHAATQSDTSTSAISTQQDTANTGETPAGGTRALANAELSLPSALGDGEGAEPALGQVPSHGSAIPGSARLQPDLSGTEGPELSETEGDLPDESPSVPGAPYPPPGAAPGPVSAAETPAGPDLDAAQGAPLPMSFGGPQPWGMAAGAPQGAGLPGANGPGSSLNSAWDAPSSAAYGPVGPPSAALGSQLGTNPGQPAAEGLGAGTAEQAEGTVGSGTGFDQSQSAAAGSGMAAGMDQLPATGLSSGPASSSDAVSASSISASDGTGPIQNASPDSDSLSAASPASETRAELTPAQGTESTGDEAQEGNPENKSLYMEMSPSSFSTQQDTANTGETPAGREALANAEPSPSALGDGAGAESALGQVSPAVPALPSSTGLQPEPSRADGAGDLPGDESPSVPGAPYPPPGAAPGPVAAAETPAGPDLDAAQGAPLPMSFGGPQPWGMAAGAPQGAGLPGANEPGSSLNSAWDAPSSAAYGPAGPPSAALGSQLGTNPGQPAAEGLGAGTAEQAEGTVGSGTGFDQSQSAAAGSGMAAGMDQLPATGLSSGPASSSDAVSASSISASDGTGPIQNASPDSDSLSAASPASETRAELTPAQGTESTGDEAQEGNPEIKNPYVEMSPSSFSTQQDTANTGETPAGREALANAEPSPSALGDGEGAEPALGQVPSHGSAIPGSARLQPDLSGTEGAGDLPGDESPSVPGAPYPPPGAAPGPVAAAETPASPDLDAAQGAPLPMSFGGPQPWGMAAGAPQGAGLPGANGPGSGLNSAWDAPSSAAYGPAGPPSAALGSQLGTNPGQPAAEGLGAGTAEQAEGTVGSGTGFDQSQSAAAGSGMAAGMDQLPATGLSSGPASSSDAVSASSISASDGTGPIQNASPDSDSLSAASPASETRAELTPAQGTESTGDEAQEGNPENKSLYMEMSPSSFSTQQDTANTGETPAGREALANAEPSPSALGDGAGAESALGQVSPAVPALPSSTGLQPELSRAEGPNLSETEGDLPDESPSVPGAPYPHPGAAAGPLPSAETPAGPDLDAAQGAPLPMSFGGPQPWGMAAGAPQGAGLPGANGPGSSLNSAWDAPSSAAYGPAGPPSAALGTQLGTNPGQPAAEGLGAGTAEQAEGTVGSGTGFDQSQSAAAGSGMAAGMDQLPATGLSSGPASSTDAVSAPSISDTDSPSALGAVGGAPGAPQPSLGARPGIPLAVGEGVREAAGDQASPGQFQAPSGRAPAVSGAPNAEVGAVLLSASSSPSLEGSSSPAMAGQIAQETSLPGAGGAGSGLSTGLEAAGPEERPKSALGIQSNPDLGLPDARLSQVNVVGLPEGALENGAPSPGAQIASGVLAPSALASPQETQTLLPVAPDASSSSDDTATSFADALLLPGRGLSSGLAPNRDTHSSPSTQSENTLRAPGGLVGDARGALPWSSEDEVASGMPAPLGESSPHALTSPNAALALPSAPERENAAEVASAGPGLSAPLSARESMVGSSAGGKGGLGTATAGEAALLLPPHQPGGPRASSWDANSPVPGEASTTLPGAMAGRGDVARLLPSNAGAVAAVETPARSPLQGSPGLSGLPPARIAAGSPESKISGPGPARGGSSPAILGGKMTTSLANKAPAAGGPSLPAAFPGQGGSPATMRPAVSCSPVAASLAPPAPLPGGREVPLRPGATATSRTSFPMFPAPPGRPAATPTPLPGPTVPAVPLYAYGARENDLEYVQRRVDFTSPLFKPETGFPFGRTLRDSLYFTDNGQIIFPASDNSIFMYPNPPPRGFNGHEEVPMIAVFWDNADFSKGVGTTFYQEFSTLNTAKPPFVRDVEAKIRQYLRSSYSAAWTLKITWEKAPAYAARTDTRKTITYQAILTTDGFRSYVLMLYQEGGMRWDYTRLAATNVLIGYTSGDGFYRNDDLTQRPPAAKYRPDQLRGYNTDLRGLWIYKLESRVSVNYRLKCLAWIGRQQEPRAWSQGLPPCPCSLHQGQKDPRFKSSRGGWWAARISMLHSASPNQHGAGVRCLYDSQSQLVEGRQERYWRSSRQASPYRDQELKLYDWCCNQAGSARLCAHYSEKRPKIGCGGYQPPGPGSSEEEEGDSEEQRDGEDK